MHVGTATLDRACLPSGEDAFKVIEMERVYERIYVYTLQATISRVFEPCIGMFVVHNADTIVGNIL